MALRDILARFRIDVDAGALRKVDRGLTKTKKSTEGLLTSLGGLQTAFAAAGAALAGNALRAFVGDALSAADAIDKMSKQVGLASDEFQILSQFALESGASAEDLRITLKSLSKNAVLAAGGNAQMVTRFTDLGIAVKDANGKLKSTADLLFETGGALGDLENPTERVAKAQGILGEASLKLLPGFEAGSKSADALRLKLQDLAVVYDKSFIAQSVRAKDEISRLRLQFEAVRVSIVSRFLPGLIRTVVRLQPMIRAFSKWTKSAQAGRLATIALGGGMLLAASKAGPLLRVLALLGRVFLKFLLPIAIIEDLWVTMQGGDSVTKRLVDGLLGIGTTAKVVKFLQRGWDNMFAFLDRRGPQVWEGLTQGVADMIQGAVDLLAWLSMQWDENFGGMLSSFEGFGKGVGNIIDLWIVAPFLWAVGLISDAFLSISVSFNAVLASIVETVTGWAGSFFDAVFDALTHPFDTAVVYIKNLWSGINSIIEGVKSVAGAAGEFLGGAAQSRLGARAEQLGTAARSSSSTTNSRSTTINDHRNLTISSGSGNTRDLNRAASTLTGVLNRDRRSTLAGVGAG